jgi:inner membrane protein
MALCLAHATAGYLAYEILRPPGPHRPLLLASAVGLANAPDLDFLPGFLLGQPSGFHRGITHTILAVLMVTVVAALVVRRLPRPAPWGGWIVFVAVAYGSHLAVDLVSIDTTPPEGTQMLWPLSDVYLYAPISGLGELPLDRSSRTGFLQSLVAPEAMSAWGRELALMLAVIASVQLVRLGRAAIAARPEAPADS